MVPLGMSFCLLTLLSLLLHKEMGLTMIEWHRLLYGREFEQTPGNDEGQGNLVCWSLWGRKELTPLSN